MAQRLPTPGGDTGTWGTILNGFLGVSHDADGTLKTAALTEAGGVTSDDIDAVVVLTQAEYNAIGSPSATTLYVIV